MKSDPNKRNWAPTLTLAKLFEEQNQFYDALAAYELMSQHDASPAIREHIESLQMRILNDTGIKYDTRIQKLFSAEELAYLKVMSHSGFENLAQAQEQIKQGIEEYDVFFEDEDIADCDCVLSPADELQQMLEEIDAKAIKETDAPIKAFEEPTVGDMAVELIKRYGKDKSLSDLSVKEFMQLILDFNIPVKTYKS